ncbi:MAG: hypothetical protein ICV64_09600 [Thermoleophilia bacterium]|nr:hypothetical protein [Thermoleophilia bacterium]
MTRVPRKRERCCPRWNVAWQAAYRTNEVENPLLDSVRLGVVASELAWDAVLSCFE